MGASHVAGLVLDVRFLSREYRGFDEQRGKPTCCLHPTLLRAPIVVNRFTSGCAETLDALVATFF
jgi:hypothetical protein